MLKPTFTTTAARRERTGNESSNESLNVYRTMTDEQLEAAVAALEHRLDALDSGYWPSAAAAREEALEELTILRAEQERRRC